MNLIEKTQDQQPEWITHPLPEESAPNAQILEAYHCEVSQGYPTNPAAEDSVGVDADGEAVKPSGDKGAHSDAVQNSQLPVESQSIRLSVDTLKEHPLNQRIYGGAETLNDLIESIKLYGLQEPLLVTPEGKIISGHRRWKAAKELGVETVPVRVKAFQDEGQEEVSLIEHNKQRIKTNQQIAREAEQMISHVKAARKALKTETAGDLEKFPKIPKMPIRDEVGKQFNLSGKTIEAAIKTVHVVDQLREEGKEAEAKKIEEALEQSIDRGYQAAKTVNEKPATNGEGSGTVSPAPMEAEEAENRESEAALKGIRVALDYLKNLSGQQRNCPGRSEWIGLYQEFMAIGASLSLSAIEKEGNA